MQKDPGFGRLIFLIIAGAFSLLLLVVGAYQLYDFTESTVFCGKLCHKVMYPEYTTYQESPHSRVRCADCHVGPGANYLVQSKIAGIPMIFGTLTGNYPKPIQSPVENLRPARDTCEECHWPEMFSGDLLIQKTNFAHDENNSQTNTTRFLDLGGGQSDTAKGIHWHITAEVNYISLDTKRTDIVWIQTKEKSGTITTYVNPAKVQQITPDLIKEKRLMDCVDCHNRAAHIFQSPNDLIDKAMGEGQIDKTLPFVKRESMKILDPPSSSLTAVDTKIEAIRNFYEANYPEVVAEKQSEIDALIGQMQEVARLTTFPDMQVDYKTHLDFSDHQNGLGCFRCHGKLVASSGIKSGQTLSANCSLCHITLDPTTLLSGSIPHTLEGRQDCLTCHGLDSQIKPFPSNHMAYPVASCTDCHSMEPSTVPSDTNVASNIPHGIQNIVNCLDCHSGNKIVPFPVDHSGFDSNDCTKCHAVQPVAASNVPHSFTNLSDCSNCHGSSAKNNLPVNHLTWPDTTCTLCHSAQPVTVPAISHPISGVGSSCLNCHASGNLVIPQNHQGLKVSTCARCHVANPPSTTAIPHLISGSAANCLSCHRDGAYSVPASHNSYENNFCTLCHAVNIRSGPTTPHLTSGTGSSCLSCHGVTQAIGAAHASYGNSDCASCHSVARVSAPRPHSLTNRQDCLSCHASEVPRSHSKYTNNSCALCHTR